MSSASLTTRKMSDRHEDDIASILDGTKTRGSGSTWHDKADGHQRTSEGHYRFAWDGKSTLGKSIGVSVEMWKKIKEQSGMLEPAIPLRFYADERLTKVYADLIVVDVEVFAEMQRDANEYRRMVDEGVITT